MRPDEEIKDDQIKNDGEDNKEMLIKMKEEIQTKYNSLYEQLNQLEKNKQIVASELIKLSGQLEILEKLINNNA